MLAQQGAARRVMIHCVGELSRSRTSFLCSWLPDRSPEHAEDESVHIAAVPDEEDLCIR